MEQSLARTIWLIYLQAEGMSGVLVILVCGTLYAHRRRVYFLYWTLAWVLFALWRLLNGLSLGDVWLLTAPATRHGLLGALADVCGWWHISLWLFGLLHLRQLYYQSRVEPTGNGLAESHLIAQRAPPLLFVLLCLAGTVFLALLLHALIPAWSEAALSGVMAGVYSVSAAWFAVRWRRTNQLGVFLLPVALELCALARLYSAILSVHTPSGPILIPFFYQNALLDFLLQTLVVVAMIVVLLHDEETVHRETGQRLAESEDRFRLLFEHGGVGMALLSPDGDFVQVNSALEQMLGRSASELVGRHLMDVMYEEDRSGSNMLRGKADALQYEREKRFVHGDGRILWTRIVRVPIKDAQGAIRYHATFFVDITGHKRAEETMREQQRMEEQLHRARRMATLVTLVGGVAHDFNNQLTAILGNLDLLRLDLEQGPQEGKPSLESIRPCLRGVEQAAQRCARMTSRLLTFSRGRLGAMQTVALDALLTETAAALQHELPRIKIEVHTAPGSYAVMVDIAQVQELLLNLATNASEAMPGGGTLTLALAPRTFRAEDCDTNHDVRPGSYIELTVRDTGSGIAPENVEYIFDPFFTTKRPAQGAGMGLSVVFGIIKAHKGWITVQSQIGQGTTFHIYLPAAPAPAPSIPHPALPMLQRTAGERILVVDDEPLVRDLAKTVLERRGFHVVTAGDGDEALDIYRRQGRTIDVILLDYIMPRMNGMQVLKELRQLNPDVCVLFSSGYHTDHDVDQLLAAGARGFVAKPYRAQDLVQCIRQVLGG